jgi:hypothetical protein
VAASAIASSRAATAAKPATTAAKPATTAAVWHASSADVVNDATTTTTNRTIGFIIEQQRKMILHLLFKLIRIVVNAYFFRYNLSNSLNVLYSGEANPTV